MIWLVLTTLASAATLISDDFNRTGTLDGSSADIGTGTWAAGAAWTTNAGEAAITASQAEHAFFPFVPEPDTYYILSAELEPVASSSISWFGLGFAQATGSMNTSPSPSANFHEGGRSTAPWLLRRHDGETYVARGPRTGGIVQTGFFPNDRGTLAEVCLDTRSAAWEASFRFDGEHVHTTTYSTNPTIQYVGFGTEYTHREGAVRTFRVQEVDPDPDGDGIPVCEDLCLGDDSTGDPDGNGICTDLDVEECDGVDGDGDGLADEYAACRCLSRTLFGKTYDACRARAEHAEAADACGTWGSQLVQLETASEADAISQALDIPLWPFRAWWIGLSDASTEGLYTWLDGTSLTDASWGMSQPAANDAEDCVGLFPSTDSWYERPCDALHGFVCEVP